MSYEFEQETHIRIEQAFDTFSSATNVLSLVVSSSKGFRGARAPVLRLREGAAKYNGRVDLREAPAPVALPGAY